jgi:hypothetical protein
MVDAYLDKKIEAFDDFYFNQYGPKFRQNWETAFQAKTGRPYSAEKDFPVMYNDLVAAYQNQIEPLTRLRMELRDEIAAAHDQVAQAHQTVGAWIHSVEKLKASQRDAASQILAGVSPALSLEQIETRIDAATTGLINQLRQPAAP